MDESVTPILLNLKKGEHGYGFRISSEEGMHRVADVSEGGNAWEAGLRQNDVLVKINDQDVTLLQHVDIIFMLQNESEVSVEVIQHGLADVSSEDSISQSSMEQSKPPLNKLTPEEDHAFKPFENLHECLGHPAHCALFLSFLLQPQGVTEDEMLLLLNLRWMLKHPSVKSARAIYHDFLAVIAPMRVDCVTDNELSIVEKILSSKHTRKTDIINALNPVLQSITKHVAVVLHDFNHILRHEPSQIEGASALVNSPPGKELEIAEALLIPHLHAAQAALKDEDNDHVSARHGIIEQSILAFLEQLGASGKVLTRTKSSMKRSSKVNQKIHFVNGHQFVTTTYTHFTYCAVCKSLIYGLARQGWDCLLCGMHVHKAKDRFSASFQQCHKNVKRCTGFKEGKRGLFGSKRRVQRKANQSTSQRSTKLSLSIGNEDLSTSLTESISRLASNSESNFDSKSTASNRSTSTANEIPYASVDTDPDVWQATVSPAVMKSISDKERKRQELIFELIQTEKKFARDLFIFKELFRQPLVQKKYLSSSVLHGLFGKIDALWDNNSRIAKHLEALRVANSGKAIMSCASVIMEQFRNFDKDSFASFCSGQQRALLYYEQQLVSNPRFAETMELIEAQPIVKRLTFRDFVAKPLQRLTKYPLLFKGILKYTQSSNTQEVKDLKELLTLSQDILRHVQSSVQSKEDIQRLNDITHLMDRSHLNIIDRYFLKDIMANGFQLVHEGKIKLKCNGKFVEVHIILLTHVLIICQVKEERLVVKIPGKDHRRPVITVDQVYVRSVATEKKGFFVISGKKAQPEIYEFRTSTSQQRTTWMDTIEKTCKSFNEHYPDWIESVQQKLEEEQAKANESSSEDEEYGDDDFEECDLDTNAYVHYQIDKMQELLSQIEDIREHLEERLENEDLGQFCQREDGITFDGDSIGMMKMRKQPSGHLHADAQTSRATSPVSPKQILKNKLRARAESTPVNSSSPRHSASSVLSTKDNNSAALFTKRLLFEGKESTVGEGSNAEANDSKDNAINSESHITVTEENVDGDDMEISGEEELNGDVNDENIGDNSDGDEDGDEDEDGPESKRMLLGEEDKEKLYYATQYAYALERIAQLTSHIAKLEGSVALNYSQLSLPDDTSSIALDMHEPSDMPPEAPSRERSDSIFSVPPNPPSSVGTPPVNEVSQESFI